MSSSTALPPVLDYGLTVSTPHGVGTVVGFIRGIGRVLVAVPGRNGADAVRYAEVDTLVDLYRKADAYREDIVELEHDLRAGRYRHRDAALDSLAALRRGLRTVEARIVEVVG